MSDYAQPTAPAQGDRFSVKDYENHLVLVYPSQWHEPKVWNSDYEAAPAVTCSRIVVLSQPGPDGQPVSFEDTMVFGRRLVSILHGHIKRGDKMVLAVIKKKLKSEDPTLKGDTWDLAEVPPHQLAQAAQMADAYRAAHPDPTPYAPAAAPAAAPTGGFGAPAAAPQGFGAAPAAAPTGFGAPAPAAGAPAGFGAPAAAPAPVAGPDYATVVLPFLLSKGVPGAETFPPEVALQVYNSIPK